MTVPDANDSDAVRALAGQPPEVRLRDISFTEMWTLILALLARAEKFEGLFLTSEELNDEYERERDEAIARAETAEAERDALREVISKAMELSSPSSYPSLVYIDVQHAAALRAAVERPR